MNRNWVYSLFALWIVCSFACMQPKPVANVEVQKEYLQPIITQYFIDNKSEIWLLFLIAHSKR